jgi:hypothetical protein
MSLCEVQVFQSGVPPACAAVSRNAQHRWQAAEFPACPTACGILANDPRLALARTVACANIRQVRRPRFDHDCNAVGFDARPRPAAGLRKLPW